MDLMRMKIVSLLHAGRENIARLKVVDFIDQKILTQVLEIVIPFCELIARRLASIESEREVPPDMKEAIATLCYVGLKYSELPSLVKLRWHFSSYYSEQYLVNLTKSKPDCCVNKQIMKLLLLPNPTKNERNKFLKEIALRSDFSWDPGYKCKLNKWDPSFGEEDTMASAPPNSMSHNDTMEIVPVWWKF
ncbi:Regulator of Vps4 activity in the MVB pathway protein [Trifolium repens]|nr:Regulator of Vps4 activity in the MVB pathway protein [Trifolium repens]